MRVVITGANGQLGQAVRERFAARTAEVIPLTREQCDISHSGQVDRIGALRPSVIVNCAAWTDVDGAEDHPGEALEVNAIAVAQLARVAGAAGATLVHISTDFVFDGAVRRPHAEGDPPRPQSVYAMTKLLGEGLALSHVRTYVLRVESLFGGPKARSSVDRIIDGLLAGAEVPVFSDRTVSPTYTPDAADAIAELVERDAPFGLYHCVNTGATTWEELGREILMLTAARGALVPVRMASLKMRVARPLYCALSNDKLRAAGVAMPTWQDALRRYLRLRGLLVSG